MTISAVIKDSSLTAWLAGFLAVLISYSGPLVIVFYAAQSANISSELLASWIWAISIGAGLTGIYLSWRYKVPIITAWSAPGTALLVTLFPGISISDVVGSYICAAVAIFIIGITGSFDWLIKKIPKGIAAGMLAGILFQFALNAFKVIAIMPMLSLAMMTAYLFAKRLYPKYLIVIVFSTGIVVLGLSGSLNDLTDIYPTITSPIYTQPSLTVASFFSFTLPLILVSLTGQFLPGMSILKMAGYHTDAKPIMAATSVTSIFTALFGGITTVIAAITAAICTGKDAHINPEKRYIAGIANGVFYLLGGIFASTIVAVFAKVPPTFIAVLAGLALLSGITTNLSIAIEDQTQRDSAVITFLVTVSGMTLLGIGSAFWGIVFGLAAHYIFSYRNQLDKKLSEMKEK
ncbi:benzoate/H(+) symporter BenE family transporter [Polynucleobacter sp. MWH-Loch1C5]|uniref:benzoate/H(+) symporter BenE family transporter n=1 Tax=Polynucleobacter sp. MWH-Loch1C5 TaxID=2689108 RepID=UPI001C0B09EF|nr:benzoate/H(+) symporter BenE family transporter [Polynucleobacter sp. MWH-Loch1C5]MBU3541939.1 benzoate/H(+) symporter BenE family transporter [Polynucleobacter sp. MWH-Loch1C5]